MDQWHYLKYNSTLGPVSSAELRRLYDLHEVDHDTLVWTQSYGSEWRKLKPSDLAPLQQSEAAVAPTALVNNAWAWAMVLVPPAGALVELLVRKISGQDASISSYTFIYFIPYLALMSLDISKIRKAGLYSAVQGIRWWILIVPVYIYKRSTRLMQPKTIFVAWLASFFGSAVVTAFPSLFISDLPSCSSLGVTDVVKRDFQQIATQVGQNLTALGLAEISETSSAGSKRSCSVRIRSSDAKIYKGTYDVENRNGSVLVRLTVTGEE